MTRQILVGGIPIGGGAPVVIQSMLNTRTTDVEGSLNQIKALATAGCQVARLAVPNMESAGPLRTSARKVLCLWLRTFILTISLQLQPPRAELPRSASTPATSAERTG